MVQTVYGLYHHVVRDGKVVNDSAIAVGSIHELCKVTGVTRLTLFRWLTNPPQGLEMVRLFKEVH